MIGARPYQCRLDAGCGAGESGSHGLIGIIEIVDIVVDALSQTGTDDKDGSKLQTIDNLHNSSKQAGLHSCPNVKERRCFPRGALDI